MGLLDNNLFRLVGATSIVSDTSVAVTQGTLKSYTGIKYQYAILQIEKSNSSDMSIVLFKGMGGGLVRFPALDTKGNIYERISKSGIYFLDVSGASEVAVSSLSAVSGLSVNLRFRQVVNRPLLSDIRNEQTIATGNIVLSAGATSGRADLYSDAFKEIFPHFKFFILKAVYRNANNTDVYKSTFRASCLYYLDDGKKTYDEIIATSTNIYSVTSGMCPVKSKAMTVLFYFDAAAEGDNITYEIVGIR